MAEQDDGFGALADNLLGDQQAKKRTRKASGTDALAKGKEHLDGGDDDEQREETLTDAVASLGDAIEARDGALDNTSGDGGAHHAAHDRVVADMAAAIEAFEPDTDKLVFQGRDLMLTLLKQQDTPWRSKSKAECNDIAIQVEEAVRGIVAKSVELTRSAGKPAIRALLVGFAQKDGITAQLKVKPFDAKESDDAVLALSRATGKHVLIIVASVEDFAQNRTDPDVGEGNEPMLSFDAGYDPD